MYVKVREIYPKLLKSCKCFKSTQVKQRKEFSWIKPAGIDTNIKLYNSITKTKVPLILRKEGFLTWYMCGPTVYDSAHIGHAITYVKSDIIQRILSEYFNIHTLVIMGITDVDDKIITRSIEEGRNFIELSRFYENEFFSDMKQLNVRAPYLSCRVTEYIPQIIEFISNILIKNGAYVTDDGSVYFDTKSYNLDNEYGKLSVPFADSTHVNKRSSLDFALWKAAKNNEPYWESPWGHGRPGWHIECSAMASSIFGKTIDIHSGGIDLIFPHHENEEAQSCCYHMVDQWVNYWLHSGHLCLKDNIKMSKSLKNTISIKSFLEKYTANHMRMLCLLSHYRNNIIYSNEVIDHAVNITNKIVNFINECNNYVAGKLNTGNVDEVVLLNILHETKNKVHVALADDFNTSKVLHEIIKLVDIGNKMLSENHNTHNRKGTAAIGVVSMYISNILSCLGITQSAPMTEIQKIDDVVKHFLEFRNIVRNRALQQKPKDQVLLCACDTARENLSTCGITIKDRNNLSTWDHKLS